MVKKQHYKMTISRTTIDKRGERGIAWALALRHTGDAEEGGRIFGTEIILANLFPEISKEEFRQLLRQQRWEVLRPTPCQNHVVLEHSKAFPNK